MMTCEASVFLQLVNLLQSSTIASSATMPLHSDGIVHGLQVQSIKVSVSEEHIHYTLLAQR